MYKVTLHLFADSTLLHHVHSCDWRISLIPREGEIIAVRNDNGALVSYKVHNIVYLHEDSPVGSVYPVFINAHLPAEIKPSAPARFPV